MKMVQIQFLSISLVCLGKLLERSVMTIVTISALGSAGFADDGVVLTKLSTSSEVR